MISKLILIPLSFLLYIPYLNVFYVDGHYQLLMGFNVLLPDKCKIPLPSIPAVPTFNDPLQNP